MMKTNITIRSAEVATNERSVALALGVHPETQLVHVGHDQPGDEGPEVAAPAGEADREVPTGDDEQDGDPATRARSRRAAPR